MDDAREPHAGDRTDYMVAELVSGTYFDTLRVQPADRRLLNGDDDGAEGAHPVCVISYGLWQLRSAAIRPSSDARSC